MKWILLLLFGGLGLGAMLGGAMWGWKRLPLFQSGTRTTGVVVDQEMATNSEKVGKSGTYQRSYKTYTPIVEFTTASGENFRFTASSGGKYKPLIATGAEVEVIYDPADPNQAQVAAFSQFWLGPLVVGAGGLIFLLMGVGGFFLLGRHDQSRADSRAMAARQNLVFNSEASIIKGTILRTEQRPEGSGRYVFICRGERPGSGRAEEYASDFFPFDPGPRFKGRQANIHLDPTGQVGDYVNIDPLLSEIMATRGR